MLYDTNKLQREADFVHWVCNSHNLDNLSHGEAPSMRLLKTEGGGDIFGDTGLLKGDPVDIALRSDTKPYKIQTPWKVEVELEQMKEHNITKEIMLSFQEACLPSSVEGYCWNWGCGS